MRSVPKRVAERDPQHGPIKANLHCGPCPPLPVFLDSTAGIDSETKISPRKRAGRRWSQDRLGDNVQHLPIDIERFPGFLLFFLARVRRIELRRRDFRHSLIFNVSRYSATGEVAMQGTDPPDWRGSERADWRTGFSVDSQGRPVQPEGRHLTTPDARWCGSVQCAERAAVPQEPGPAVAMQRTKRQDVGHLVQCPARKRTIRSHQIGARASGRWSRVLARPRVGNGRPDTIRHLLNQGLNALPHPGHERINSSCRRSHGIIVNSIGDHS